jgi:hypothetical protein
MTILGYKRVTVILSIVCVALLALCVSSFVGSVPLRAQLMMAGDQVHVFEEMRSRAVRGTPSEAAGCLEYVANYYPSGTKQVTGSQVDRLVEQARASAIREILADLRSKTGEDLGTDAEAWIQKYSRRN